MHDGDDREPESNRLERASADDPDAVTRWVEVARAAPVGGEPWVLAHRQLAELAIQSDPWRAALLARRLVHARPGDAHGWALLGLAQSLLGHLQASVRAYERALALSPDNPYYAHNLGHLYDVGLGRLDDALRYLGRAFAFIPEDPEIAASFAHALARRGRVAEARRVLGQAERGGLLPHHEALRRWIREGAPEGWTPRAPEVGRRRARARRAT